jgi:hypothetical protein
MIPKINITTNYELFKFSEQNRPVSKITSLVESIKKMDLTEYNPILVDTNFNIIDGQHRFEACKQLNLPIHYITIPATCENDIAMVLLNKAQRSWRLQEYIHLYSKTKGGVYKQLEDFENEHHLGVSNSIIVFPKMTLESKFVKVGEPFEINPFANQIVDFLKSKEIKSLPYAKNSHFVRAVKRAFEKYNSKEIDILKKYMNTVIALTSSSQYLNAFENIISKRSKKAK